ncbi:condensation domain-containing protein [Acrocarpospora corrugata]|uniref:condensation domain-containing protein n=1 Tax=Acrocarpospora corrugata TaxID=35763 RepID=UPI001FEA2A54|nr:condensation domain-containing protein [Acrocarpospora corrugata]
MKNANLGWGQRYMWLRYHDLPPHARHNTHIILKLQIPVGLTIQNCRAILNQTARRHETLRTTYHFDLDGDPYRVVRPPGPCPLVVVSTEEDGTPMPAEVMERLGGAEFDIAVDWPIRTSVITTEGVPQQLVLVLNHLAVDMWTVTELQRELQLNCTAVLARRLAAIEPVRHRPSDLIRYETTLDPGPALAYWEKEIESIPPDAFGDRRRHGVPPETRRATLVSPALLAASRRIAARQKVWPSQVHLAAYTALMAAYTGGPSFDHLTFTGNRENGPYATVLTCMFSPLLLRVDVSDDPTFTELLARVGDRFEQAREHAYVPYDEVAELLARKGARLASEFNFIKQVTLESRARRSRITWQTPPEDHGADTYVRVDEWKDAVVIALSAASSVMDADSIERFLRAWETTILSYDATPDALRTSDIAALAGFAPAPPPSRRTESRNIPDKAAEEVLAAVVGQANGLAEVDPAQSYTGTGGRVLRIPRVLALLRSHGWEGVTVHQLTGAAPLSALACLLAPAASVTPSPEPLQPGVRP